MEKEDRSDLTSPLISIREEDAPVIKSQRCSEDGGRRKEIIEEVKKQLWIAGPLITVYLLQLCLQVISVMFVGHLGELALSGAAMAASFSSVTGISVQMGMASALDTLCGQSYGAKQYHMLGILLQRAMLVLLLVSVPLAFIWANTETILTSLGQDPEISEAAGLYARSMIPMLFAHALLQCFGKFLQAQNIIFPMVICSGITTFMHFFVCWVLVFKSSLGYRGAAFANSFSYWINVVLLAAYIKFSSTCARTWTGFSKQAFQNISAFLRLAIPSTIMVCLSWWGFEMMILLSGLLPNPKLETSVLSISHNTGSMIWMIPFGLASVVSIRVSNELGAGNSKAAQLAVHVALAMVISEGFMIGGVLILIRNIWGYAYSNEVEIVRYVAEMMPILAVSNLIDGFQGVLAGTARGCGWQKIGACVNLGSYYLVGIPSAVLLAFVLHIGGKGLWLGIVCALFVQAVSLFTITMRTNWETEAMKAKLRIYDSIPVNAVS